jgi:hypothetical protein
MAMMNRMPGPMGTLFKGVYQEIARLKGVPLRTRVSGLRAMDLTTEATAIATTPIPDSVWALPTGYALQDSAEELKAALKGKR